MYLRHNWFLDKQEMKAFFFFTDSADLDLLQAVENTG